MANVAFLVEEGFEDAELSVPLEKVRDAGHTAIILSSSANKLLKGKRGKFSIMSELTPAQISPLDVEGVVIPGGHSPDRLRTNQEAIKLIRGIAQLGRFVAAICHGGSLLVEANLVKCRRVTSWPSIRTDLENAGAIWEDKELVHDGNLITSRKPEDLPAFCHAILQQLGYPTKVKSSRPIAESY